MRDGEDHATTRRPYASRARRRQADDTRRRIVDAARRLMLGRGYDGTTVEAIAEEAGVATQTVYAAFRSKRGILAGVVDRADFGPGYEDAVRQAVETTDPVERLRIVARIARRVHDALRAELELLRGAGVVSPELAALERGHEGGRYEAQAGNVDLIACAGKLRQGIRATEARDILWALTGREMYRMLVVERGWTSDRYEVWLANTLIDALLSP